MDIGDGDLVRLARTGDAAAFRLLAEPYRRWREAVRAPGQQTSQDLAGQGRGDHQAGAAG